MTLPIVTDHCVLRYFERVMGIEVETTRRHIALLTAAAVKAKARSLIVENHSFKISGQRIVTVTRTGDKPGRQRLSVQRMKGRSG